MLHTIFLIFFSWKSLPRSTSKLDCWQRRYLEKSDVSTRVVPCWCERCLTVRNNSLMSISSNVIESSTSSSSPLPCWQSLDRQWINAGMRPGAHSSVGSSNSSLLSTGLEMVNFSSEQERWWVCRRCRSE